jgi:hypothetical protein
MLPGEQIVALVRHDTDEVRRRQDALGDRVRIAGQGSQRGRGGGSPVRLADPATAAWIERTESRVPRVVAGPVWACQHRAAVAAGARSTAPALAGAGCQRRHTHHRGAGLRDSGGAPNVPRGRPIRTSDNRRPRRHRTPAVRQQPNVPSNAVVGRSDAPMSGLGEGLGEPRR